jgi:hypothetical protein
MECSDWRILNSAPFSFFYRQRGTFSESTLRQSRIMLRKGITLWINLSGNFRQTSIIEKIQENATQSYNFRHYFKRYNFRQSSIILHQG